MEKAAFGGIDQKRSGVWFFLAERKRSEGWILVDLTLGLNLVALTFGSYHDPFALLD